MSKEIQPNVVMLADYSIINEGHTHGIPTICVKVLIILKGCILEERKKGVKGMGKGKWGFCFGPEARWKHEAQ